MAQGQRLITEITVMWPAVIRTAITPDVMKRIDVSRHARG
jgi:hypothetical protein